MNRDFTLEVYNNLCTTIIDSGYTPMRVDQYMELNDNIEKVAIIRHDVDRKPENALKMAQLERSLGFCSSYYFRTIKNTFNQEIISQIKDLGHEIGYHYEVLAVSRGDKKKAARLFETELEKLRKLYPVKTICMHGSPLSKWKDSDLWDDHSFKDYGIIGDAFLSINYKDIYYFTDTGRSWASHKYNLRDKVDSGLISRNTKDTFSLIKLLPHLDKNIAINAHPDRWNDNYIPWTYALISQNIKNLGKYFLKRIIKNK